MNCQYMQLGCDGERQDARQPVHLGLEDVEVLSPLWIQLLAKYGLRHNFECCQGFSVHLLPLISLELV